MKKLTQIPNQFNTSNFVVVGNIDGKIIDFSKEKLFKIIPSKSVENSSNLLDSTAAYRSNSCKKTNPFDKNHPQIANYKQITASVNDYLMLINKQKLISIQKAQKKYFFPIEPIETYNSTSNSSIIIITK